MDRLPSRRSTIDAGCSPRRRVLLLLAIATAAALPPSGVHAQGAAPWPAKPIRLVSPFNPGGAIDVLNRILAEKLSQRLGQQVFVDAIPGANTIKGADVVAKAAPDGYTFMITTMSTHVNNTVLFTKLPFDPVKDFAPITQVSLGSVLLTAPATAPYGDLKGFVAWAKAQKRPVTYGSWGVGSSANVYGEILAKDHGVSLTHVPYKGEQPAIADVIGGNLDVTFASPVGAKPQVIAAKLKALGMTGPARSAAMADVPTFAEQGFTGFELPIWVAAYAPAGTPKAIVNRLATEVARVVALPDVRERFLASGLDPVGSTPAELGARMKDDYEKWTKIVRKIGIKLE